VSAVQSVERAFDILRALAAGPAGVTELAERIDLPKSTVSRMLSTLEAQGAVEQIDGGGPYRLGPFISEIARTMGPGRALLELAGPVLDELTRATGEAAGLSVREGLTVRFILQTRPTSEVQVRDWTGTTAPLHVGPSGLMMLAHADAANVERYLAEPLVGYTDRTVTDLAAIRARLASAKVVGSEWVYGEFSTELNSVAAPVFHQGLAVAAVHVHGPTFRFPGDASPEAIASLVRDAAGRLTDLLNR
jgi:IclR family transcriptional regulator, acetate operon repressor